MLIDTVRIDPRICSINFSQIECSLFTSNGIAIDINISEQNNTAEIVVNKALEISIDSENYMMFNVFNERSYLKTDQYYDENTYSQQIYLTDDEKREYRIIVDFEESTIKLAFFVFNNEVNDWELIGAVTIAK